LSDVGGGGKVKKPVLPRGGGKKYRTITFRLGREGEKMQGKKVVGNTKTKNLHQRSQESSKKGTEYRGAWESGGGPDLEKNDRVGPGGA